ncbi:hypothetical protein C0J52_26049 [Blattella germanica]|nr:hypothetical protein C0J52_26049 [Blattella germanica]
MAYEQSLYNLNKNTISNSVFQILIVVAFAALAMVNFVAAQGQSYVQLGNGLGYKYNYGIQHAHHGHHHGSSYPHAYGGYGGPGYHIGSGYYTRVN